MFIRFGHEFTVSCTQPTPMVCLTAAHVERSGDLMEPETLHSDRDDVPVHSYYDIFGNVVRRFVAPVGDYTFGSGGVVRDSGLIDDVPPPGAGDTPIAALPDDTLMYLMGSRYCETDLLSPVAWQLFGGIEPGWPRVQAISEFVNGRIAFNYQDADATRTAFGAFEQCKGVCRDFTHLGIAFCRAMNIPARYVNGYLGDIGVPAAPYPMDFSAWMEVFVAGKWYTLDPRHHERRIGRIVVARGRDAADVPLINSFGPHLLAKFEVWTDEVVEA
ncbi:transglutaminase-like domain-containing protein [Frigidibacter sp. MR17.24]|uniref:transglutaminase-like domain-containing protein n=1 Tax=Frigidibacter sp. MR17.24 TaxID=3127345 RepID=UPI003012ED40